MKNGLKISGLFILILFALTETSHAQDCITKAENMGLWVRNKDSRPTGQENAATIKYAKQITTVVDSVGALFMNSYPTPFGSKIDWGRVLQPADSVTLPDYQLASYLYSAYVLAYRCKNKTIEVDGETAITIFASFNDYYKSGYQPCTSENKSLHDNLFMLPPQQFSVKGYPGFASIEYGWSENIREMSYSVLVHEEGKLPYKPVSVKEYFDLCLQLVDINEKKDMLELMNMKKGGTSVEDQVFDNLRQKAEKSRESIRKQIQRNSSKLDKPAILIKPEFLGIYSANDPNTNLFTLVNRGYQLVRPNTDYVNQNQEKWKPQYIWVSWIVNVNNSPYYGKLTSKLDKMIREEFDFGKLGKMLNN